MSSSTSIRQEDTLRAGGRPDDPDFGVVPPDRWGRLVHGDAGEPVPSERGRWSAFYDGVGRAVRDGVLRRPSTPPTRS